jgi:hypothetical protein
VQYYSTDLVVKVITGKSTYQNIWTDLDASFLGGICLPSSCSTKDVKEILKFSFKDKNLSLGDRIYCKNEINKELELKYLNRLNSGWVNNDRAL